MMADGSDIIVIGAGASGLMAARELSAKGKRVVVLEAKPDAGGRIHTIHDHGFEEPVEGGAEFVHGNLPLTLGLLTENGIGYTKADGEMLSSRDGIWEESNDMAEGWDELTTKMNSLQEDIPLSDFLRTYFPGENDEELRESALQYAQGFDAVDPGKASTFALRDEWEHEEGDNYRVGGGYKTLIDALLSDCRKNSCVLNFNRPVTHVTWKSGSVEVSTQSGEVFRAEKLIVTVPLGVLKAKQSGIGLRFSPALPHIDEAVANIGYGNVIKILLQFRSPFWQEHKEALFFFSNQPIGTWWTQFPSPYPLLTGWIAGAKTGEYEAVDDGIILQQALQSVACIFGKTEEEIRRLLTASRVINWQNDKYALGAYSYNMIQSEAAKETMREPVEDTLFFAGEGVYSGVSGGTVEAALVSGRDTAAKVLAGYANRENKELSFK